MLGLPAGIATGTAMVQTPVELVDGTGHSIVPIHKITVGEGPDRLFTAVADMAKAVGTSPLVGNEVYNWPQNGL